MTTYPCPGCPTGNQFRSRLLMASKRSASSDLNHENWDQEDTPEEAGTFSKASQDVLKKRVFKTAKRRIPKSSEEGTFNVFNPANLALLTSKSSQPAYQLFGQLSNIKPDFKTNGIGERSEGNGNQAKTTPLLPFGSKNEMNQNWAIFPTGKDGTEKVESKNTGPLFSFGNIKTKDENNTKATDKTPQFSFGNHNKDKLGSNYTSEIVLESKESGDVDTGIRNLDNYYSKIKGLNESVAKWIDKHVKCNPLINLQPIFKDYEKFFDEIEKERHKYILSVPINSVEIKSQTNSVPRETDKKIDSNFSFDSKSLENKAVTPHLAPQLKSGIASSLDNVLTTDSSPTFSFGSTNTAKFGVVPGVTTSSDVHTSDSSPKFSFKTTNVTQFDVSTSSDYVSTSDSTPKFSFGSTNTASTGFTAFSFKPNASIHFGNIPPPASIAENRNEEESDEPPKLDIKQVEEEGHIYTIRCKLFVKKDGNFIEKGIGSLFLKPVPNTDKVQLIVRAHNSLGNVLCNFILSKSIPTQRMGKNNVMIVCIPTPESQPPPVSVLIKVKTGEDADQLLKTLEKHKK